MSLPNELYEVFKLDEGTRPAIFFEQIAGSDVIDIYAHIKEFSEELHPNYLSWSNKLEANVELRSFNNPAVEVVSGELDPFCHRISTYSNNGLVVNNISIFLFSESIEIFYDVRDINSSSEVENILMFIKNINNFCKNCIPFFAETDGTRREEKYQCLLAEFLNA